MLNLCYPCPTATLWLTTLAWSHRPNLRGESSAPNVPSLFSLRASLAYLILHIATPQPKCVQQQADRNLLESFLQTNRKVNLFPRKRIVGRGDRYPFQFFLLYLLWLCCLITFEMAAYIVLRRQHNFLKQITSEYTLYVLSFAYDRVLVLQIKRR